MNKIRLPDKKFWIVTISVLVGAFPGRVGADDWAQWQGPDRNAVSKETGLLEEWPQEGPPLAWRIGDLGGGDSSPSIAAGRIFGMSNRGSDEVVWALSEKDGSEIWVTRLGPAHQQGMRQSQEGPGCTPTVDGERLYVLGMGGSLACLQAADGKVVWQRNLVTDFGGVVPTWSYRESPLIDGEKLICTPGGEDATLVALNKLTGDTIWKTQMPSGSDTDSAGPGGPPGGSVGAQDGADRARGRSGGTAGGNPSAAGVAGTRVPGLFVSEHWGMSAFACKTPNGTYLAKLYFAETYQGITGPGQRVFSFNVHGQDFKDFDIWVKAGGPRKAYIETVPVEVTDGEFRVTFAQQVENPAIKAIEIIPQGELAATAASSAATIRINAGLSSSFTDSSGQVWQPDSGFEGGMTNPGIAASGRRPRGFGGGGRSGFGGFARSGAAYASPIAMDFEGQRQYVQLTARALIGVAATDGRSLWQYDRPANRMGINCSTPIYRNGMVFAASAYGAGGGLVKLSKDVNGEVKAEEMWSSRQMENHHGGVVLLDGALYGANGGNSGGYLACLDFQTGEVVWNERDPDKRRVPKGSVAVADDLIYYRTEEGTLILIQPNRQGYVERSRFEQPDRSEKPAWAHPVIANGRLYVRDQGLLLCYDVKRPVQ